MALINTTSLTNGANISSPSLPSIPSTPSISIPNIQTPNLPSITTPKLKLPPSVKINTLTGAGVPGGLDVGSIKSPTSELAKLNATAAAISAKKAAALSAIASGAKGVSMDVLKKLDNMSSAVTSKLKAATNAPDFSKSIVVPSPPRLPTIPNFSAAGIPEIPSVPSIPKLPSIPSIK